MKRVLPLVLALSFVFLTAAALVGGKTTPAPPSNVLDKKSLPEWMEMYFTWSLGAKKPDHVGNVEFLPVPNGEYTGGAGTPEDPWVYQGHLDVTLKANNPFVLPVAVWMGWTYDPVSGIPDDLPLDPSAFYGTVELDGQPIEVSYFEPVYFDPPIPLPPESGGLATIYVQGLGFVHPQLSVGTHTLTLVSGMTFPAPDYSLGVRYKNTWTITVRQ